MTYGLNSRETPIQIPFQSVRTANVAVVEMVHLHRGNLRPGLSIAEIFLRIFVHTYCPMALLKPISTCRRETDKQK